MRNHAIRVALCTLVAGCYRSHSPLDEAADAGAPCVFTLRVPSAEAHCSIAAGSSSACTEAMECLCAAQGAATPSEQLACVAPELTPRALVTLSDFCTLERPARGSLAEALRGLAEWREASVTLGAECEALPALIGPRPYSECWQLGNLVCPSCGPEPCDVDAAIGRACLALEHAEVQCIIERIGRDDPCSIDLAGVARACAG